MLRKSLKSLAGPYTHGKSKESFIASELKEGKDVSLNQRSLISNQEKLKDGRSVTVESQPDLKKKIWKGKSPSSNNSTQIMKLLKILDQASTQKEKVLTPFWTKQSEEISKRLWLPTETDSVVSILRSSKELSKNSQMGRSWFSIKKIFPQKRRLQETSSKLSQFSLPEFTDSEATLSNDRLKTLKIRIFPTQEEKDRLHLMFHQYRWYYNALVSLLPEIPEASKYSSRKIRDLFMKYRYEEEVSGNLVFCEFVYDEGVREFPTPEFWNTKGINRLIRGAVNKFTYSLNAAKANLRNRNIKNFKMSFMTKKSPREYLHFEDRSYPVFIRNIESRYWFTTPQKKKVNIPYSKIFEENPKGLELIYEKSTDRYFIHCPVDINWFPKEDRRNESQTTKSSKGDRLISLDPGIRKFLTGYDPDGNFILFGEGACHTLLEHLCEIDKLKRKGKDRKWLRIKNLLEELHWKISDFLTSNYDHILLPNFRTSQMVSKKNHLSKKTRRLMNMFSFYKFKEKMMFKCLERGKNLYIVDESYTSKTCGQCGTLNDIGSKEIYTCSKCKFVCDRDVNGARNILIKNLTLRSE
jgi:IS605 OrfB family transposase